MDARMVDARMVDARMIGSFNVRLIYYIKSMNHFYNPANLRSAKPKQKRRTLQSYIRFQKDAPLLAICPSIAQTGRSPLAREDLGTLMGKDTMGNYPIWEILTGETMVLAAITS